MAQGNNYVNNAANNLISINQSTPKPTKKKSTLTRWKSSKDVDLSYISSPRNNDKNKKKSTKITFLSTNYDTRMNVDKEEDDIKNSNFEFKRSILTISDLENVLIESPPIVHISSHGFHKYKTDKHKAFQIALEEPQPLRYLIDKHPKLSAYYATIAILFEMEINHFIQYGFKKSLNNQPLFTSIWKDDTLLSNDKIYNILVNISDRFGCSYMYNTASKCIEIFWGEYNNSLQFISPPYTLMNSYQLSTLYQHDEQVQKILNAILDDYNQYDMDHGKEYQRFSWPILIDHILDYTPNENVSFDNISEDTADIDADEIEAFMSIDDEKDRTAFAVGRLTKMKFGINQNLTREIKIIPLNEKTEEQISVVKHEIIHSLKQTPDIQINFEAAVSKHIHIIRFVNEYALVLAEQKMNEMRINGKYNHEYDIKFRDMSKADVCTRKQVGFIAETQEKIYSIDIKNKRDPISKMLKKYLKSKEECKIKLLVLNGCHSYILGKIFSEYVENVICIHPFVKIYDKTATTFTKYFYESLQKYINPRILFSHSVLHAYNIAKINISKECSNDFSCESHSHFHPITYYHNKYIQQTIKLKQSEEVIHFNENWKLLQNHINNKTLFEQYRNKIIKDSCVIMEEPIDNLYDNKTLIISNISEREMNEIKTYLERYKPAINEDEKQQFVEKCVYQSNEYYPELSVAYFKFKTLVDINEAKKILSQKISDEEIVFSDQMLKSYLKCNSNKIEQYENIDNLGWIYRTVPRCCCSPFYPHIAMDKLILLQNGNIVNRGPINSKSQIKNGLHKIRIRQQQK